MKIHALIVSYLGAPAVEDPLNAVMGKAEERRARIKRRRLEIIWVIFQLLTKPKQVSMYASSLKRVTNSITTVPHILEVLEGLRSVHTNRFVCTGEFCENLCRCNRILWPQIFLRLVAAKKFCCGDRDFHKNSPPHTKRFVAATCRRDMLLQLVARPLHMEWSVAATCCCNLSPSVYRPLRAALIWNKQTNKHYFFNFKPTV